MSIQVQDKVALVTGANRGIGKAILESLLDQGAKKVYAAVRKTESASPLIEKYGDRVVALQVDMEQPETIQALAEQAKDVQLLVNNAGVLRMSNPLSESVVEDFNFELQVNVFGLIHIAKAFAPVLEKNANSALIQLNSVASIKNFHDFSTYSASKAAAYSITQGLKDSFSEKGIHVLSVHPGPINTDMAQDAGFGDMVDSVDTVPKSIIEGLAQGAFHVFPDKMAKDFEGVYKNYAETIVEASISE